MNCPQCGYEQVPEGIPFCPSCGQALPQASAAVTQIQVTQPVERVEAGGTVTGVSIGQVIGTVVIAADEETEARRRRYLRILLEKVKEFWIDGVLLRSVQGAGLIELDKTLLPEAVELPWEGAVPGAEPAALVLPPGKTIADVFQELDHALLVLDGVGAGKTVSLLALAREAIGRAERDPLQPIPVVLNLSSWAQSRQPIADWVVEELNARYQIPARLGRQWLDEDLLALLLDGLDEVKPERLPACIAALNRFRQDHGLMQIGVCCRTQAYEAAGARLKLSGAILLQPLTAGQIEGYLAAAGPRAEALRAVLQDDTALQALAHSPLMLNMMRLAYQDVPLDTLRSEPLDTPEERRHLLLGQYVDRMFQAVAGTGVERYSQDQTRRWLAWLAQGMSRHNQSLFRIESLQPSWLPDRARRWLYALLTRTLAGLLLALGSVPWGYLLPDLRAPAWGHLFVGAMGGLVMGLADALRFELGGQEWPAGAKPGRRSRRFQDLLAFLLSASLIWAAIYLLRWTRGWVFGLKEGLMFGLMFGLLLGVRNRAGGAGRDTETVEALAWSPAGSLRGALAGLGASLLMAVAYAAVAGLTLGWWTASQSGLIFLSIFGPTLALIGSILGGLRGALLETRTLPNQSLWLSARNALLVGLAVGLAGGLGEGLTNALVGRVLGVSSAGLAIILVAGLFWASVAALWYGGLDLIKHLVLRAILWLGGQVPWRYGEFLSYAVERSFLQRAGGGYLFANRLLQEHFADLRGWHPLAPHRTGSPPN